MDSRGDVMHVRLRCGAFFDESWWEVILIFKNGDDLRFSVTSDPYCKLKIDVAYDR